MSSRRITRRQFTTGALAAAGGLAVTRFRATAEPAAKPKIRAAVIGIHNRGWQDLETFQKSGRFDVTTLCDCDTSLFEPAIKNAKLDASYRPRVEQDFRRVLDDKTIDAVVIATPDHWHGLMTVMALDAGKHVYLEKPASYNIDDGKAMVVAQRKHPNLVVGIGTQQRGGRHFKDAKAFIDGGGLGTIGFIRAWITHVRQVIEAVPDAEPPKSLDYEMWVGPAPYRPYNRNRVHYNWHWVKEYGTGETANWGGHWLDVARWFADLDVPTAVSGHGGQLVVHDAKEWPDTQTVVFEFPKLTVLWENRLWSKYAPNGRTCGVEFAGSKGTMVIDRSGWTFFPQEGKPVEHPGSELEGPHVENFADAIEGKARIGASIFDGHKAAIMCHMANIVTQTKERLVFDAAAERFKNSDKANALLGREYRSPWKNPPIA